MSHPPLVLRAIVAAGLLAGTTSAEVVTERWGQDATCRHRKVAIDKRGDGSAVLHFDVSDIPRGAKVYRASLRQAGKIVDVAGGPKPGETLHAASGVSGGVESPDEPIRIMDAGDGESAKPLVLESPRFASFAATEAVRRWAADPKTNKGLLLKPPAFLDPAKLLLEISYEGKLTDPPPAASGVKAFHRAGQTFITWTEIDKLVEAETLRWANYEKIAAAGSPRGQVLYRIYRADAPITAATIASAELIDEVGPLSGYDGRIHQNRTRGEIFQGRDPEVIVPRYCIAATEAATADVASFKANSEFTEGNKTSPEWLAETIPLHTGLYVHKPPRAGKSYYAVVTCVNGVENTRDISAANALADPVVETVGAGEPILYRRLNLSIKQGRKDIFRETQFFTYWANPPLSNLPQEAVHVLVGVEYADGPPEGRSMHVKVGIRDMYWSELVGGSHPNEWAKRPNLLVALVDDRSVAAIGYHGSYQTLRAYSEATVEPYTIRKLGLLLPYIQGRWKVNPGRVSCNGAFLGLHLPHIFTFTVAGGHQSVLNLKWSPLGRALPKRWGPPETARTAEGGKAYDLVDASVIVRADPAAETPFLLCPGGKGPGHQVEIGWTQDPKAYRALMDTRRPFAVEWGTRMRQWGRFEALGAWDHNVPAFGHCSLDDNPGSGHLLDGDFTGQINGYLWWDPATGADETDRWSLTVHLVDECAADACTVDVTPRRLKKFKPRPGEKFTWTNTSVANGEKVGSGEVTADEHGLVTLRQVAVTKGQNRLEIAMKR